MKIIVHNTANSYMHLVTTSKKNSTLTWNIKFVLPIYDIIADKSTEIIINVFNQIEELENTEIHLREAPNEYAMYCMIFPKDKIDATKLILMEDIIIKEIKRQLDTEPHTSGTIIMQHWSGNQSKHEYN